LDWIEEWRNRGYIWTKGSERETEDMSEGKVSAEDECVKGLVSIGECGICSTLTRFEGIAQLI
jgi:hypothetical protein